VTIAIADELAEVDELSVDDIAVDIAVDES
jgi:hypothetical protein